MSKSSGLGDNFYVDGYDLSGDTQMLGGIGGSVGVLDVTGIDKSAHERIGGLRAGVMNWTSFFNPAASHSHAKLKTLPRTDVVESYFRGTTLGNSAASMVGKQIGYNPNRGADGSLLLTVESQSNGYGLCWGRMLTAGLRTDVAATNGASINTVASASFGWAMAVHLIALTGANITISVEDSANDIAWVALSGATTTAMSAAGAQWVVASSSTATVRQYLRAVTTGTFTSATFAVNFIKGEGVPLVF